MLRDLDLSVEAGEMVAIVGASGVGKSTLLHVLGGLDRADEGAVLLGGTDLTAFPTPTWWRCATGRSGSSSSSITCCPSSARSKTPRCRCGSPGCLRSEPRARAEDLLRRVGLGERLTHRPGMLSGGEQQRVAVARALAMRPAVLLADEPTGDLDEQTAESLHALLREMHRAYGLTSVIATHNPRLAAACDRILRLEGGRLSHRLSHVVPPPSVSNAECGGRRRASHGPVPMRTDTAGHGCCDPRVLSGGA